MPYRYAHHVLAFVLLPTILFAFWPHYFGDLRVAPFAFHAHGLTATAWILLVTAQGWSVHAKRFHLHRQLGRALFIAVPLFVAGGTLALQSMSAKFVTRSDPFYAALGPLLGLDDVLSTIALVLFVRAALVHRRRAHLHGGYLLATVMLVIPPIVARLNIPAPPAWHVGEMVAMAPAIVLFLVAPRQGRPFVVFIGVMVAKSMVLALFGFRPPWVRLFSTFMATSPLWAAALAVLSFAVLWSAWRPARLLPVRPFKPAIAPGS